jgi:alpha-L-arabinofuranosidase
MTPSESRGFFEEALMIARFVLPSLLSLLLSSAAAAETRVRVEADKPGPTIDKNVYGQFAEHLGRGIYEGLWVGEGSAIPNTHGLRNDVVGALKDLRVPVVRWPGGCYADQYHWRDGVGTKGQRKKTINGSWGGIVEDNSFGTHEFFELVEQLGADAYVSINVGTGSPQEMAEWVEYMTSESTSTLADLRRHNGRQKPWRVSYLGIGNETWGCGGSMTPEYSTDVFKRFATFIKTPENNRPLVIASGGQNRETNWTRHLLENVKESWTLRMDGISHHYYTVPSGQWEHKGPALGFPEQDWFSTLFRTLEIRGILTNNGRVLNELDPKKKVGFVLDEWGTWYDTPEGASQSALYQQNSLRDAVLAALNFHVFHEFADRVRMTNIAQMVNVLQSMILTEGPRMLLTPTYHAFHLYRPFQGARHVPASVRGAPEYRQGTQTIPKISATAAVGKDGKLYLGLINTHPREAEQVHVDSAKPIAKASGRMLTGSSLDAHNTFAEPNRVHPTAVELTGSKGGVDITLPPRSIVVLALD